MKIFNPSAPEHGLTYSIFNCRLKKANKKFDELFASRCKRAFDLVNKEPVNEYELNKALQAAIDMKGLEETHFELVLSDSYEPADAWKKLLLLKKLHNELHPQLLED